MTNTCESCQSEEMQLMGQLGHIFWLCCRDCGWQQEVGEIDQEIIDEMCN